MSLLISVVISVALAVVVWGGATLFVLFGRPRIPSTAATSLRIIAIMLTLGCMLMIGLCASLLILESGRVAGQTIAGSFFAYLLLAPTLVVIVSCSILYPMRIRQWQRRCNKDEPCVSGRALVQDILTHLCEEMGLNDAVPVAYSTTRGGSPIAMGWSRRHACLVLPCNIHDLALRACDHDAESASALLRLVLAHELAHVRNNDLRALPLLYALRGPLAWCYALILVAFLAIRQLDLDQSVVVFAAGAVDTMTVGWLFLLVMLRSTLNERERLADATASMFVPPTLVHQMARVPKAGTEIAPLERFVFSMQSHSFFSRSILGFAVPRPKKGLLGLVPLSARRSLKKFRTALLARIDDLRTKKTAITDVILPTPSSILITGALGGLLHACFALTIVFHFDHHMLLLHSGEGDLNAPYLKAMSVWSRNYASCPWFRLYRLIVPLAIATLMSCLLLLPLRDARSQPTQLSRADLLRWVLCAFFSMFAFELTFALVDDHFYSNGPRFSGLTVSKDVMYFWLLFAVGVMGSSFPYRESVFLKSAQGALRGAIAPLCWLGLAGATILVCCSRLSMWGRALWAIACFFPVAWLSDRAPVRWFAWSTFVSTEWIRLERLLWWRRLSCTVQHARQMASLGRWYGSPYVDFVRFFVPVVAIVMSLYPWLVDLDTRFLAQFGTLTESVRDLVSRSPDAIANDRAEFAREFLPKSFAYQFLGPDKLLPSTALGFITLASFFMICIVAAGFLGFRGKGKREGLLSQVPQLVDLGRCLGLSLVPFKLSKSLHHQIETTVSHRRPYFASGSGIPMMKRTCQIVECARHLRIKTGKIKLMLEWITKCEQPTGGYGAAPGVEADVLHTASAIRVLRAGGTKWDGSDGTHSDWIERAMRDCVRHVVSDASDWLEAARATLDCLTKREARSATKDLRRSISNSAALNWKRSLQTPRDAHNLIQIVHRLSEREPAIVSEVRSSWLPPKERLLPDMQPDARLAEIVDTVRCIQFLYPASFLERESIQQVADNVLKWYKRR